MDYQCIITIEPGKRGGRPCIRRMRIAAHTEGIISNQGRLEMVTNFYFK